MSKDGTCNRIGAATALRLNAFDPYPKVAADGNLGLCCGMPLAFEARRKLNEMIQALRRQAWRSIPTLRQLSDRFPDVFPLRIREREAHMPSRSPRFLERYGHV